MLTKGTFEDAARIARDVIDPIERAAVVRAFLELFRGSNPRFDAERFRTACEPGEPRKRRK